MEFRVDRFLSALAARVRAAADQAGHALIAIDGRSCAGKSELARVLAAAIGPHAAILPLDGFFVPLHAPGTPPAERRWRLDWDRFRQALVTLKAGRPFRFDAFDWTSETTTPVEVKPGLVIVEGLYTLRRDVRDLYDFRIWVEGRLDSRIARIRARDGDRYLARWIGEWLPIEEAYIAAEHPAEAADLIVAGADLTVSEIGAQLGG